MTDTRRASVGSIRAAIADLLEDDVLWVNRLKNLSIVRDGEDVGYIGLPHDDITPSDDDRH